MAVMMIKIKELLKILDKTLFIQVFRQWHLYQNAMNAFHSGAYDVKISILIRRQNAKKIFNFLSTVGLEHRVSLLHIQILNKE